MRRTTGNRVVEMASKMISVQGCEQYKTPAMLWYNLQVLSTAYIVGEVYNMSNETIRFELLRCGTGVMFQIQIFQLAFIVLLA